MSNDQTQEPAEADDLHIDQLAILKQRAALMGITHSNNISVEKLKKRIEDQLEGREEVPTSTAVDAQANPLDVADATASKQAVKVKQLTLRQYMNNTQMRLVRLRITNMDPKKKDLHGEIITVANEYLGTVRKFVPFGEVTDGGYHVPYCIYRELDSRKFLNIVTRKDLRTGQTRVEDNWAKEFSLEILPQLTSDELNRLAVTQAAANGMGMNGE